MHTATQVISARTLPLRQRTWWPLALGAMAVALFALTLPMTRLANGSMAEPQWPPLFVAAARAALAGGLAALHLLWVRAAWPQWRHGRWFAAVILGGVLGFPLGMGWAVRMVPASHAAVLTGLLPLSTAALASWWLGQRPRVGFWLAGMGGAALICLFVWLNASHQQVATHEAFLADGCLMLGLLGASMAYVGGARLAREMPPAHVMSWSLVFAWPLTLVLAGCFWPAQVHGLRDASTHIVWTAWAGLAYVSVFSTWVGFFLWYAALAKDAMRVSQIQLLQPFLAILASGVLLDEAIAPHTWLFASAVLALVLLGQRFARPRPLTASPSIIQREQRA